MSSTTRHTVDVSAAADRTNTDPDVIRYLLGNLEADITVIDIIAVNNALALIRTEDERGHNPTHTTNRALASLEGYLIPWGDKDAEYVAEFEEQIDDAD
jgi:hypothetical protein